jgi:type IV pilus assembly protein PilY1
VIQIIKPDTPASAIQLNVAGDPSKGYRVTNAGYMTYVLAEYSVFWHHPSTGCYTTANTKWTNLAPPDNSPPDPSKFQTPAPGSDDPKIGSFRSTAAIVSVVTTVVGNVTTITTTYSDGAVLIDERTRNDDGTVTIKVTYPDGTVETKTVADSRGDIKSGGDEKGLQAKTGRVSWHELVRE